MRNGVHKDSADRTNAHRNKWQTSSRTSINLDSRFSLHISSTMLSSKNAHEIAHQTNHQSHRDRKQVLVCRTALTIENGAEIISWETWARSGKCRRLLKWVDAESRQSKCILHGRTPVIQRRTMRDRKSRTFSSDAQPYRQDVFKSECKHVCANPKSSSSSTVRSWMSARGFRRRISVFHVCCECVIERREWNANVLANAYYREMRPTTSLSVCNEHRALALISTMVAPTIVIDFVVCVLWRLPLNDVAVDDYGSGGIVLFCMSCTQAPLLLIIIGMLRLRLPASICVLFSILHLYFQFHNELQSYSMQKFPQPLPPLSGFHWMWWSMLLLLSSLLLLIWFWIPFEHDGKRRSPAYGAYVYSFFLLPFFFCSLIKYTERVDHSPHSWHSILILKWMNRTEYRNGKKIK